MNKYDIKKLLDAFYNGETGAEEERILKTYFNGDNVAEELSKEKELFLNMFRGEPVDVPPCLEAKLNNLVDELAKKEIEKEAKTTATTRSNRRTMWTWIGSVAAGVAIVVSAGMFFDKPATDISALTTAQHQPVQIELSDTDKQAVEQAADALVLLSGKFNKGMNQLAVVSSNINKTNEILKKTFNHKKI